MCEKYNPRCSRIARHVVHRVSTRSGFGCRKLAKMQNRQSCVCGRRARLRCELDLCLNLLVTRIALQLHRQVDLPARVHHGG